MADAAAASVGAAPARAEGGELGDGIVEDEGRAGGQDRDGNVEERTSAGLDAAGTAGDEVTTTSVLVQEGRGLVSAVTAGAEEEVLLRETDASEVTGSGRFGDGGSVSVKENVLETSPGMEDQVEAGSLVCGKSGDAVDVVKGEECGMASGSVDDGVLCTGAAGLVDGGRRLGDAVDVAVAGTSEGLRVGMKGEGEGGADVVDEVPRGSLDGRRAAGGDGFGVQGKDFGEGEIGDRQGLEDVRVNDHEQGEGWSAECEEVGGRPTGKSVVILVSTNRTVEQSVVHGESEGDCCGVCGHGVAEGCAEVEGNGAKVGSYEVESFVCTARLSNDVEKDVLQPEGTSPAGTGATVDVKQVEDVPSFGGSVLGSASVVGMEVNDVRTESEIAKRCSREEEDVACAAEVRHEVNGTSDVCMSRLEKVGSEDMELEPSNVLEQAHVITFCTPETVSMTVVDKGSVAEPPRAASAVAIPSAGETTETRRDEEGGTARHETAVAYTDTYAEEKLAPTISCPVVGTDEPRAISASGEASCGKATCTGLVEEVSSSLLSGAIVQESVRNDSVNFIGGEMKSEAEADDAAEVVATGDARLKGSIITKRLLPSVKVEILEDVQKDKRLEQGQGPEVVTDSVGEVLEDSAVVAVVPDCEQPGHLNVSAAGQKASNMLDPGTLEEALWSPQVGGRPASMDVLPIPLCGCGTQAIEKVMGTKSDNRGLRYLSCAAFSHKQPNGKKKRQLEANGCKFFQWLDVPRVTEEEKRRKQKQKRRRLEDPGPVSSGNVSTRSASKHAHKGKPSPEHVTLQPSLDSSSMLESTPPASEMSGSSSKQQTTSGSFEDQAKPPGGTAVSKVSKLKVDCGGESASGSEIAGKSASDSRSEARSKSGKVKAVKSIEKEEYPEDRRNPTVDWLVSKRLSFKSLSDLGDGPLASLNNKNVAELHSKRRNLSSNSKSKFGMVGTGIPGRKKGAETLKQTRDAHTGEKAGSPSVTASPPSAKKVRKVANNTVSQSGSHASSSQRKRASADNQKGMKPGILLTADRHTQTGRDTNTNSKTSRKTPKSVKARQGASVPEVAGQNVDDETEADAQPAKRMKAGDRNQVRKGGNKASKPEEVWVTVPLESPAGSSKEAKQKGSKLLGENARAHLRTKVVANLDRAKEKRSAQAVNGTSGLLDGNLAATQANILSDTGCTNDSVGRSTASKDGVSSTCSGHSAKMKAQEVGS